jgi:hypothetical protein
MSEELAGETKPQEPGPELAGARRRRLIGTIKLPALSGWTTGFLLFACFLVSALAIPLTLRLPQWVEAEIVLAVWWLIWVVVLSSLLYTRSLVGPIEPHQPREPIGYGFYSGNWGSGWGGPGALGVDVPGCLIVLVLLLVFPALIWVVIEVAIPLLALVLFGTVRGMLARVVNSKHGCRRRLGRSLGWAALWATAYTAPLALLVWWIHGQAGPPVP